MPWFGKAIRTINNNPSGMRQLAGRDFEDLLQVCDIHLE